MRPTIGRIVVFVEKKAGYKEGLVYLPAIIVAVRPDGSEVNLKVFTNNERSAVWVTSVKLDESAEPKPHTWHWPPKGA